MSEVLATACLIFIYIYFIGRESQDLYHTEYLFLYSILNIFFAAPSGDSAKPARSFGPAVITRNFSFLLVMLGSTGNWSTINNCPFQMAKSEPGLQNGFSISYHDGLRLKV